MKKSAGWFGGIMIMIAGCGTHTPLPQPPLAPVHKTEPSVPAPSLALNPTDPYCCTLPQELDVSSPVLGPKINDLERFEQSVVPYVEQSGVDRESLLDVQKNFDKAYYTPWSYTAPPITAMEASWPLRSFRGGYGSNLRPLPPMWFQEMAVQANFEAFGTLNQKAIALRWMDLRALPTPKPLYRDPSLPGEGYPFDMLQNSSVNYQEPLFISHTSIDGAWSYVFSNSASGWVPSDGITPIDEATADKIRSSEKLFVMEDNVPLYDSANRFVAYSRIGMVLPIEKEQQYEYYALAFESGGSKSVSIHKTAARIGTSRLNREDLARIGEQMLKNTYGWGGMYGERDCSSMIRDMYTPFGIWLPRNSASQAKRGEVISLEGLSNEEKLSVIKTKGIPFETIVYLKGHVLLYAGTYQENVLMMHNVWGIRTIDKAGKKGRQIVGKAVISTLELGSELEEFDPDNNMLGRVVSMNIFTKSPVMLSKGAKPPKKKKKAL
ncbi:MAG: SH3 domain-containing protein [Campylobacterales bacterium]|nr:SH3 domain-containing protein [Campylobacterales bacterium]